MQNNAQAANRSAIYKNAALIILSITLHAGCGGNPAIPFAYGTVRSAMEPKPFPVENLEPTASIGVVSLLSDELHLRYDGASVFQNRNSTEKVPQWKVDEYVATLAAIILASRSTYRVGVIDNHGIMNPVSGRILTYIPIFERAEKQGFDTVIVIRPFDSAKSNYFDGGYGLWDSSGWKSVQSHCAYSWVVADAWDVGTKDKIGYKHSKTCERDESIKVMDQMADYSATEQVRLERLVKKSLISSTNSAIRKLGLY